MFSQLEYELNAFPYDIVEPSPELYQPEWPVGSSKILFLLKAE